MATLKAPRRSVSPFGFKSEDASLFTELETEFEKALGKPDTSAPTLDSFSQAAFVPAFFNRLSQAAANDAPDLEKLCQFLLTHKLDFETKGLDSIIFSSMEKLFEIKTEIFLIAPASSPDQHDSVLFAKERDILVGRYFAPMTEKNPGQFSEFLTRWIESENLDRILHFLDFSLGSKNPTFEHYLIFSHPALKRVVTNKNHLRTLLKKTEPLLKKLASSTWESSLKTAFEL